MSADTPEGEAVSTETTEEKPKETTEEGAKQEDPPKEETPKEETPKEETPKETPKEEKATEAATEATTKAPTEVPTTEPTTERPKIYQLIGMSSSEDTNIDFQQTHESSAGLYKCVVKSTKEKTEMIKELRVIFKPEEGSKPELTITKNSDNYIHVRCTAPASRPMTTLNFFINYESAPHEDIHRLDTIRTTNTSYGETDELLINVEELRIRATKQNVLNDNILIVCSATLADIYSSFSKIDIPHNGSLYSTKCLSAAVIVLIIFVVIIAIIVIVAVVWVILRKKRLNSLNKVSELFNKQKSVTVLVDNNTNDLKVE